MDRSATASFCSSFRYAPVPAGMHTHTDATSEQSIRRACSLHVPTLLGAGLAPPSQCSHTGLTVAGKAVAGLDLVLDHEGRVFDFNRLLERRDHGVPLACRAVQTTKRVHGDQDLTNRFSPTHSATVNAGRACQTPAPRDAAQHTLQCPAPRAQRCGRASRIEALAGPGVSRRQPALAICMP